jgi:molecular chaperone Hsp33
MTFLQQDRILRATGDAAKYRLVLVDATRAANRIADLHEARGYSAQLLGEAVSAALLLASGLKGPGTVQLRFQLSGDISRVSADATPFGLVRAMIPREEVLRTGNFEPMVLPQTLRVLKLDRNGRRLSEGIVDMVAADLSESVTHYLKQSEQGASLLRVAARCDSQQGGAGRLTFAGGLLLEAFPGATDADWSALTGLGNSIDFTAHARPGSAEGDTTGLDLDTLYATFADFSPQIHKEFEIEAFCPCSEEGVLRALASLGRDGLESLYLDAGEAELFCEFCRKRYVIGAQKLLEMMADAGDEEK